MDRVREFQSTLEWVRMELQLANPLYRDCFRLDAKQTCVYFDDGGGETVAILYSLDPDGKLVDCSYGEGMWMGAPRARINASG